MIEYSKSSRCSCCLNALQGHRLPPLQFYLSSLLPSWSGEYPTCLCVCGCLNIQRQKTNKCLLFFPTWRISWTVSALLSVAPLSTFLPCSALFFFSSDQRQISWHQFHSQLAPEQILRMFYWISKLFTVWHLRLRLMFWRKVSWSSVAGFLTIFCNENPDGWEWVWWWWRNSQNPTLSEEKISLLYVLYSLSFDTCVPFLINITFSEVLVKKRRKPFFFYWPWDRSPSLRSVWTVCWRWTRSCWSSKTGTWAPSSRMRRWGKRTPRQRPPPAKPGSTTACGFCPSCGSACTLTGSPCWHCLTGKRSPDPHHQHLRRHNRQENSLHAQLGNWKPDLLRWNPNVLMRIITYTTVQKFGVT